jgi:hypothetical protein
MGSGGIFIGGFLSGGLGVIDPMGHHRKMGDFLEDLILLIVGVTLRINLTIIQSLSGDLRALLRKFGIGIENKVSCPYSLGIHRCKIHSEKFYEPRTD